MKPASPVYTGRPDDGNLGAPRNLPERLAEGVGGLPFVRGTDEYGAFYESRWTLNEHDLATLVRGGSLILRVWGASHPMVRLMAWPSADAPAVTDAKTPRDYCLKCGKPVTPPRLCGSCAEAAARDVDDADLPAVMFAHANGLDPATVRITADGFEQVIGGKVVARWPKGGDSA